MIEVLLGRQDWNNNKVTFSTFNQHRLNIWTYNPTTAILSEEHNWITCEWIPATLNVAEEEDF